MRSWFLAVPLATALLLGACGGDDDDSNNDTGAPASETVENGEGTPRPKQEVSLPAPTPVGDEDQALSVVAGETNYTPTLAELRALPTTEIEANGTRTGISIATLASQVGAEGGVVTVQGLSEDLKRLAYARGGYDEIASETVLVLGEAGHFDLYSSVLPESEWVKVVIAISFQ